MNNYEWKTAQIEGLMRLRDILMKSEVNCVLHTPHHDVGYIEMLDTPRGPHAVYDTHTKAYDIWNWVNKRPRMKSMNLSAEDAAEILTTEYFLAKAKRIRKRRKDLSLDEIMQILRRGYQYTQHQTILRRDN